jgi:hypothetical protein
MISRSVLLITLGALIAGPSAVAASAATAPSPTPGVTAARSGGTLTLTFTPQALATAGLRPGASTSIECQKQVAGATTTPLLAGGEDSSTNYAYANATVAADGAITYDLDASRRESGNKNAKPAGTLDTCAVTVSVDANTGKSRTIANVALTPTGDAYFDEHTHVQALRAALLAGRKACGYKAAAQVPGVVALASADATPPAGQVGYWTDGTHAAAVTLSGAGRRLFVEDQGGLMVRTDATGQLSALFVEPLQATFDGGGTTTDDAKDPEYDGSNSPYGDKPALTAEDGIRYAVHGRHITIRFTGGSATSLRKIGGRKVRVSCFVPVAPPLLPTTSTTFFTGSASAVVRVPRHGAGGAITATFRHKIGSLCDMTDDGAEIAFGATTATGQRFIDDMNALESMPDGSGRLLAAGGQTYATPAQIVARDPKRYVALKSRGATPPVGRAGVWTDGAHDAEVVTASPSGARFVVEDQGDGVMRANIYSQIFGALFGL